MRQLTMTMILVWGMEIQYLRRQTGVLAFYTIHPQIQSQDISRERFPQGASESSLETCPGADVRKLAGEDFVRPFLSKR